MKSVEWALRNTLALISAIVIVCPDARASEGAHDGLDAPYAFQATQSSPLDALDRFAKDHGLRLRVASAERGRANDSWRTARLAGWVRAESGRDFLEQLAQTHHFDWFVANRTLHVSARTASRVERMALGGLDPESARSALAAVGLYEPRFGWGVLAGQDAVLVGGPRAYRSLLRQFLARRPAGGRLVEPQPMIFALRHAQAADGAPSERGKTSRPGVASILRQLLTGQDTHRLAHAFVAPEDSTPDLPGVSSPPPLPPHLPLVEAIFPNRLGTAQTMPPLPDARAAVALPHAANKTAIVVTADERTNTVLVWGDPVLRTRIGQIVEALDRPLPMVAIEVLVLETDDAALAAPASGHASGYAPNIVLPSASAADRPTDARWLQALADHRARVLNRQRIVGFANRHLTLAIGAEEPNPPAPSSAPSADHATGRSGPRGDALDLVARILPVPPTGHAAIAVDIALAMRQPTGLPGQEWASTSSTGLTTAVMLESGAPPRLVAAYPVATSRARQRAVLLSAHAL